MGACRSCRPARVRARCRAPRRVFASECARRSTAMRRADDHRIPLHVTHISLPLLLERQRRMLETESLSRQTVFLSYSLSLSLSLSHPLSLSSNATLVIDAQVPLPETRNSSRILSYARCCSLKTCFLIKGTETQVRLSFLFIIKSETELDAQVSPHSSSS